MAKSVKKLDSKQIAILKKVLRYMKRYWFFLGLSLVLAAVTVASTLYLPLLIGDAVDCLLGPGKVDFDGLFSILATMGVLIAVTAFAQWVMNVCNNKMTYQIVRDIRNEAFAKIEILPLKYIDGHAHGEVVSRVIADVDQFSDGLLMGFTQLFSGVLTIFGTLGFMLSVNVGITMVVLFVTPVSLLVASFIAKRTFQMFRKQSEAAQISQKRERRHALMTQNDVIVKAQPDGHAVLGIRLLFISERVYFEKAEVVVSVQLFHGLVGVVHLPVERLFGRGDIRPLHISVKGVIVHFYFEIPICHRPLILPIYQSLPFPRT